MYTNLHTWLFLPKFVGMETLSVREYRNNLSASFTRAENGEQVLIRRKNQIFALISVGRESLSLSPELQARIDEAEAACRAGICVSCSSADEIERYLNSL